MARAQALDRTCSSGERLRRHTVAGSLPLLARQLRRGNSAAINPAVVDVHGRCHSFVIVGGAERRQLQCSVCLPRGRNRFAGRGLI